MTGRIDNAAICKYYSAIDVLVHPTYREGFGMVIQEAGALGIATITTKIPGASEVMIDNESGIHVEPQKVPELYKAMIKVKTNKTMLCELGQNAYGKTLKKYSRNKMLELQIKKIENLVRNTLV